jgi:putative ABC transport system permease protein
MADRIGAFVAARAMQSTLYGTGPLDVSVFLIVLGMLLAAALLACLLPAYRAASTDPVQVLRAE